MALFKTKKIGKSEKEIAEIIRKRAEKYNTPPPIAQTTKGTDFFNRLKQLDKGNEKLGKHKNKFHLIRTDSELEILKNKVLSTNVFALDTETTGLDPFTDEVVSIQIAVNKEEAYYIPIAHRSFKTNKLVEGQIKKENITKFLKSIKNCKMITHNYLFDSNMMFTNFGVLVPPYYDTLIASKLLNENEVKHTLKHLHKKYVRNDELVAYTDLFVGNFNVVPIEKAYYYGCYDTIMTMELYEFQLPFLNYSETCQKYGLMDVAKYFWDTEMKLAEPVSSMCQTGLNIDEDFNQKLSKPYTERANRLEEKLQQLLKPYEHKVKQYKAKGLLDNPINFDSPAQVGYIIYDIMGEKTIFKVNEKTGILEEKRPTGKDVLAEINTEFTETLLEYKTAIKLVRDFIDKLPERKSKDGKVHTSFNQVGTKTLRFSSSEPNLQQIPSKDKFIRKMFIPSEGRIFVSGDYSKQEIVIIAYMANDEALIGALASGRDIYSVVASIAFEVSYEECLEFNPNGTVNYAGKERRAQAKAVVLGILYGKGTPAIARDLKITNQVAQEVYDKVLKAFPELAKFIENRIAMAKKYGYVTTFYGTKRRLPDIQRPLLDIKAKKGNLDSNDYKMWKKAYEEATKAPWEDRRNRQEAVVKSANIQGVIIEDNKWLIARQERRCCNSSVQGSAAQMMKRAIILVYYDKIIRDLEARLVLTIHDELILDCPIENAEAVKERLGELMVQSANEMRMEIKVDLSIENRWTGEFTEELEDELLNVA